MRDASALVLFSGGQDSATCLAWALREFSSVETVGFNYGQRHQAELQCRLPLRQGIAELMDGDSTILGPDHLLDLALLKDISQSALTSDKKIEIEQSGLPNTFVPGRNLLFFTAAAALAYRRGIKFLIGGMCETDYSGYPDCRDDTLKALQSVINLGMESRMVIETPLMWLDKAQTWRLAEKLGGHELVEVIRTFSHSCYLNDHQTEHPWGFGCGTCPACELRAHGWKNYRENV